ncbi:MAG: inorganic diphosphatase [Flavobacteriales bacterium]
MNNHPWHDVSPGSEQPDIVNAIIEIPQGSRSKYEIDKQTGLLKLDRVLYSSLYYPANYGFIPQSYCDDKDPLDILVISQVSVLPLCIVRSRVIGVMRMVDKGEADDKIIAVAEDDISVSHIRSMSELPPHFLKEVKQFFEEYKRLENKTVEIEKFQDELIAKEIVKKSFDDYQTIIKPSIR